MRVKSSHRGRCPLPPQSTTQAHGARWLSRNSVLQQAALPYLQETSNCELKVHYVTSDGAPCQYKCASHFLWLSKHHARTTVYIDWSVGTPAHNKDMSDAECGGAKHEVDQCNMQHVSGDQGRQVQLEDVADVAAHLQRTYAKPKKTLEEKGGRGVYRRHIVYHCSSTDKINRRLPAADTVHGTKDFFQFTDIGVEGKLRFRPKPCHQCTSCMQLNVGAAAGVVAAAPGAPPPKLKDGAAAGVCAATPLAAPNEKAIARPYRARASSLLETARRRV